ncbi:MAG: hypothetical protein ACRD4O_01055 [Bryobacteraceae bacterium]
MARSVKPLRGSNPKRRFAPPDRLDHAGRNELASRLVYIGSGLHKAHPGDYGFYPPVNPRAFKSICDGKRVILKEAAQKLLRDGVLNGMFSDFRDGELPKYVWAVDTDGEAYEAKIDRQGYHGYRLEEDDDFRDRVLREWQRRCNLR